MNTQPVTCPGSGRPPVEPLIVDAHPWEPPAICPVCGRPVGLTAQFRVPPHPT